MRARCGSATGNRLRQQPQPRQGLRHRRKGGKRETKVIASGLDRPNGLAFKDGTL